MAHRPIEICINRQTSLLAERGKRGFNCNEQKVNGSGSSSQSHAKGSEERMAERGDKKN